ncbi:hypothetical protein [Streptomyces sp. HNM0574]|uniref:hypothetical protein n=1 Tax=Streptomyces sp. HNM0574 TaxID=2714954 RepID=UPI00146BE73D|nr:hypothetical protein [Streptomyces sp. HNM0574]NLU66831.1 hypothetical protein [Streptomyces sp. HNM0574]
MSYPPPGSPGPAAPPPYGQQPGQAPNPFAQQQPYGAPQQGAPQGPPQGYGFPQQAPGPYGGPGMPQGAQAPMPGKAKAARLLILVGGIGQALNQVWALISLISVTSELSDGPVGFLAYRYLLAAFWFIVALTGILLAVRFPQGQAALRASSIVWASVMIIGAAMGTMPPALPMAIVVNGLWLAVYIAVIALLTQRETGAWFNRPRP